MKDRKKTVLNSANYYEKGGSLLSQILGFSGTNTYSLYTGSIGLKTPESVFRGILNSKNRFIGEEYLLNFRKTSSDMQMLWGVNTFRDTAVLASLAMRGLKYDPEKLIELPKAKNLNVPFGNVIKSRRSRRNFNGKAIPLVDLASLLFYAQGETGAGRITDFPENTFLFTEEEKSLSFRTAPSGGGLFPVHLTLYLNRVKNIERGIYQYIPEHHALFHVKSLENQEKIDSLAEFGDVAAEQSAFAIVYVYHIFENMRKYGDTALAFALIEAGQIAQNLNLAAVALGLGSVDIGGYHKYLLEKQIGIDGLSKHVIHFQLVGQYD